MHMLTIHCRFPDMLLCIVPSFYLLVNVSTRRNLTVSNQALSSMIFVEHIHIPSLELTHISPPASNKEFYFWSTYVNFQGKVPSMGVRLCSIHVFGWPLQHCLGVVSLAEKFDNVEGVKTFIQEKTTLCLEVESNENGHTTCSTNTPLTLHITRYTTLQHALNIE